MLFYVNLPNTKILQREFGKERELRKTFPQVNCASILKMEFGNKMHIGIKLNFLSEWNFEFFIFKYLGVHI